MSEEQPQPAPTKNELREARREERREVELRALRSKRTKKVLVRGILAAAAIGVVVWYIASQTQTPEGDVLTKRGLHWHPELTITIEGVQQEIPTNIGIGAVHNPIHTHDDSGQIHLEMQGLVTKDDIRLGRFFQVWGKPFSATCVLDVCNGPDGTLRMLVNGSASTEFDAYIMQDKDKIELIYE